MNNNDRQSPLITVVMIFVVGALAAQIYLKATRKPASRELPVANDVAPSTQAAPPAPVPSEPEPPAQQAAQVPQPPAPPQHQAPMANIPPDMMGKAMKDPAKIMENMRKMVPANVKLPKDFGMEAAKSAQKLQEALHSEAAAREVLADLETCLQQSKLVSIPSSQANGRMPAAQMMQAQDSARAGCQATKQMLLQRHPGLQAH